MSLNEKQYNQVLTNIQANIPTDCAAYENIRKKSNTYTGVLGATTFSLSDYEAYRNDIEFVNLFTQQVLVDEKNYFEKKYGPKIYQFLLTQRQAFREQQAKMKEEATCKTYINALGKLQEKCDQKAAPPKDDSTGVSGRFMKYLLSQSPIENPDTTFRKIEYRNEAHEWLSTLNLWMTILYFILLLLMIILLAVSNKLFLRDRFMLYVFLVVLPFAFPYLFKFLVFLYEYMFPDSPSRGPKSAFVDIKKPIDGFDI